MLLYAHPKKRDCIYVDSFWEEDASRQEKLEIKNHYLIIYTSIEDYVF